MQRKTIGVIAAMPEEVAPLVRVFSAKRSADKTSYAGTCGNHDVIIVQSGMGYHHAVEGVERLLAIAHPMLIVSCGVGGAVTPGLTTGDVVLGSAVFRLSGNDLVPSSAPFIPGRSALAKGTVITTEVIEEKEKVAALVGSCLDHPVVDMETAAVLEAAAKAGIPVLALRGISDDAEEALQFSLEEFTDKELNLRISRVAKTILKKPWIIPQLLRLARNTKLAAENVAEALRAILEENDLTA